MSLYPDELLEFLGITSQGWRKAAACRGADQGLFFPGDPNDPLRGRRKSHRLAVAAAKELCGRCAVRAECLTFALDVGESGGVWGGEYLSERRCSQLRRARKGDAA